MKHCSARIADDEYTNAESTLQTCYTAMQLISRHAKEARLSSVFPDFATSIFKEGMEKGMALEDGAAIYKVLSNPN
jgi:3-hydroxyisobutyrate dehydrogenase-like beta-hydroxyacid dehydrogenase